MSIQIAKGFVKYSDKLIGAIKKNTLKNIDEDGLIDQIKRLKSKADDLLEQESKRVLKNIGKGVYEFLPPNLLKKYVKEVIRKAAKKGIKLDVRWINKTHPEYLNTKLLGKLRVSSTNPKVLELHLRPDCPKITWFHENWHLEDFLEQGWAKYTKIHKETPWLHEESVWNRILQNKNKWSEFELVDSYLYYKNFCKDTPYSAIINSELELLVSKYIK